MIFLPLTILAAAAPAHLVRVEPAAARATSALPDPTNFSPEYALDDDDKTAWVEGKPDLGKGEVLTFSLSGVKRVGTVKLDIKNGFQRSAALLAQNAAPKSLHATISSGGKVVGEQALNLDKSMGTQSFTIALSAAADVDEVALRIDDVLSGTKYKDTCVTDVVISVDGTVDAATQAANRRKLDEARAERAAAQERSYTGLVSSSYKAVSSSHGCAPSDARLATLKTFLDGDAPAGGAFIEAPSEDDLPVADSNGYQFSGATRIDVAHLKDHPGPGRSREENTTLTGFYVDVADHIAMVGRTQRAASETKQGRLYVFDADGRVTSVTDYNWSDNYNDANGGTTSPSSEIGAVALSWTKGKIMRIDTYSPECEHTVFKP